MFASLIRLVVSIAFLLPTLGPASGSVASAQGTPEPQRYGREDQGYVSQFPEVLEQLDAFWSGNFADAGTPYESPAVVPLEDAVITACGPAAQTTSPSTAHATKPSITHRPGLPCITSALGTLPPSW